ncbi:MAG: hypothetical protein LKKZDAJK_002096 [Candidatus Fervidibacter sp.]
MRASVRRRWHRVQAFWRDAWLLLRQFRLSLLAFLVLTLWGACWLWLFYRPKRLDFGEAVYATLMLIFLNPTLEFPRSSLVRPVFFVVPIIGVGIFTEAVIRFGILLFVKSYREEEWQRVMASTYSGHIIVVGIGRVGYRAAQELLRLGEEVVAITLVSDDNAHLVRQLRSQGMPVITDDARRPDVLRDAQIERARCLIVCTGNDLTNLEIALAARELNPKVRIALRLFSDALAERAEKFLGVQVAVSTSAIAAPALVAAAMRHFVAHAFYVGEHLFHVAEWTVDENNHWRNRRVGDLERQGVSVVLLRRPDGTLLFHPSESELMSVGDTLVVIGPPDIVAALASGGTEER